MERNRQTAAGVSVESRIKSGETLFFELPEKDKAYEAAREMKSYVYECYGDVERKEKGKKTIRVEHVGYCVTK